MLCRVCIFGISYLTNCATRDAHIKIFNTLTVSGFLGPEKKATRARGLCGEGTSLLKELPPLSIPRVEVALPWLCTPGSWFIADGTTLPKRKQGSNKFMSGQDLAVKFSKATGT